MEAQREDIWVERRTWEEGWDGKEGKDARTYGQVTLLDFIYRHTASYHHRG
jgi:hypothetical protein